MTFSLIKVAIILSSTGLTNLLLSQKYLFSSYVLCEALVRMKLFVLLVVLNFERSSADCTLYHSVEKPHKYSYAEDYDDLSPWFDPATITKCQNLTNFNEAVKKLVEINGKSLEIHNSNLSWSQFFDLPKELKKLKILNSTIPALNEATFVDFTKLELLTLEDANITIIDEKMFSPLKILKTLNMNHNKLTTLNKGIFDSLENLETLHLSYNSLSVIEDGVFNQFKAIKDIYLSHNKLKTVDNLFSSLNSLMLLDLRANDISKIPLLNTNVLNLFLGENEITTLDNIAELIKLKTLDVSNNYLETYDASQNYLETFDAIGGLHKLEFLNLSNNNIEVLHKSIFANLTALINLDVSHNSIKNIEVGSFHNNLKLYILDISHNFLGKILHGMLPKNFRTLNLSFNKIKIFREIISVNAYSYRAETKIFLEGNNLKCKDLFEYIKYLHGSSFHTENINGVDCFEEEEEEDNDISDKGVEILEKKFNESKLYKFLNSNMSLFNVEDHEKLRTVYSQNVTELEERILKTLKSVTQHQSSTTSIVNIILTSIVVIVLSVILLMLYFKSSYRRLDNAFEFMENR